MRLGYANTQATGVITSSYGPFFKSFGPASVYATTYDIIWFGVNGIFTSTGIDAGMGGLLTIVMKSTTSSGRCATYIYNVMKGYLSTGGSSIYSINNQARGWTTNPTLGTTGTNDDIRITFNTSDVTGTVVSWMFMGCI